MAKTKSAWKDEREDPGAREEQRVNILVVDDLPEKRMAYEIILNDLGQEIIFAASGEEALKKVLIHDFAVILLDVNMPGMNGFETAAFLRTRKKSAHTPIIFLTAFTDEVDVAQGYASGAVDYLPTPVVPEILKAKVKVFIELYQMRQRAALQAEEHALRTAAEEADKRKDEFLGMLAHELRNPLGPVRNAVHVLQMMTPPDDRTAQLYGIIDRQVTHMARLIDDLLDSTRLAQGQILLRRERCDLCSIVRQIVEDYRSIFEASGLRLDVKVPEDSIWIDGDPTRLVQAIGNLLHNAHKFTDSGGRVSINLQNPHDNAAVITIEDTGIGIDARMMAHIFDVFRQAEQGLDRNRGGLGLGLALARGLIELHNGTIRAYSDGPGRGARFVIYLPSTTVAAPKISNDDISVPASSKSQKILVIEDNRDTAETVRMLLTLEGYEVAVAYTGTEGIEKAHDFRPHTILCDIGLPGMDGYQIVRAIRQSRALSKTYVIALTGYGRDEDQRQAREAGFDLHLTKPIDSATLRRALLRA